MKEFSTPEDALCYLTECTLATVESYELQKRPPKGEMNRQKNLAEIGLRNLRSFGFPVDAAKRLRCPRVVAKLEAMPR